MDLTRPLLCFIGSAAVALRFNVPPRALATCGILGVMGWLAQLHFAQQFTAVASTFVAALLVALLAELMARVQRLPVGCFAVPGVIPLVPGFSAYNAMYGYVTDQLERANDALLQTILIAGAISAALAIAGSMVGLFTRPAPRAPTSKDATLPSSSD